MNPIPQIRSTLALGVTLGIAAIILTTTARAAAPALQGQITLRPLTPQEIYDYALTGVNGASGLATTPVGQPVYAEVLVNYAVPDADITNVTWTLTLRPGASTAVLEPSPLGSNIPTYKIADRINQAGAPVFKVAGRTMLRPDVVGSYMVSASIRTASSGNTNLAQRITASSYLGVNASCVLCHSGGIIAPNRYTDWIDTAHAHTFENAISGSSTDYFAAADLPYRTVGYDGNTNANSGGFDYAAATNGWTFPGALTSNNWTTLPDGLKNLANVQCESCHGPGYQHVFGSQPLLGDTNFISVSVNAGTCAQCHDSRTTHALATRWNTKATEWSNSKRARSPRTPSGPGREACVRCHTTPGFINFTTKGTLINSNTLYEAITCAACHNPHSATNAHQLRATASYTLPEGTTVTNVGNGAICMTCHHSRNGSAEQNIAKYKLNQATWAGGVSFGPHDSTAGDMVEGVNAITYGKTIPSGSHSAVIPNVCVGCHMQPVATTHPAFGKAGGHTYSMTYDVVTAGVTNTLDLVDTCVKCHGPISSFNFARKDYDGDGVIDGVQTEVQHLLDNLSRMLPNSTYRADGNYVADGLVKSSLSAKTNWQTKFLNAAWNWQFVNVEGSKGVHNAPYAVGVLKASIADLTGDSNLDGLPDSWQIQYFGSTTAPNAGPNASFAGDGIPNWLKYGLGLNPTIPGLSVPDGVVWANGTAIGGATNAIHIYTAAEVAFDTQAGRTYQIQAISNLGGGWQNIGAPITGTGQAISYVTPTRSKAQQYYRVVSSP
jgi:Doubled CXXCH motif (Paired_CXXCH_1)